MALAGLRGTGDWGTDERPKNFRETILWLNPNGDSPLTALLSKAGKESVNDPEFAWWEESNGLVRIETNDTTDTLGTNTSFTMYGAGLGTNSDSSGALAFVKGDLLLVESNTGQGEILQVSADPTVDTTLAVTRGVAGSTAAAIPTGTYLTKIGNAFGEGTAAPTATYKNPTKHKNYCQIFKTSYEITKTAIKTRIRTGDPLKNDKKRKMFAHSRDMELAFLFGRAYETTASNGKPLRFTGGLNNFITTNRTAFSGTTGALGWNTDNVLDILSQPFTYNGEGSGDERIAFCGNGFLTKLNQLVKDDASSRINFEGTVSLYGMNLRKVITPQGTIYFRTHPLFNIHPVFKLSAMIINGAGLKYRYMRDTNFEDNIQTPGSDYLQGQWLSECGLELHHETTFQYLGKAGG